MGVTSLLWIFVTPFQGWWSKADIDLTMKLIFYYERMWEKKKNRLYTYTRPYKKNGTYWFSLTDEPWNFQKLSLQKYLNIQKLYSQISHLTYQKLDERNQREGEREREGVVEPMTSYYTYCNIWFSQSNWVHIFGKEMKM